VLSQLPRDRWQNGRVIRAHDYGKWAKEAAHEAGARFIDLNEIVAQRYEELGENKVDRELFTEEDRTHTTIRGAEINAECVVQGILELSDCDLKNHVK